MGDFLCKFNEKNTLVLIIALLFCVYNSHVQNEKGIGQQKPVEITGMLAANLTYVGALRHPSNKKKFTTRSIVIPLKRSTQRGIVF